MASNEQVNWEELHLSEDEASAQGTRAMRFLVQQVEKAQKNPLTRPILNNLMMAHALSLSPYETPAPNPIPSRDVPGSMEGKVTSKEREEHSQDDSSKSRSGSPSRRTRKPLERESYLPKNTSSPRVQVRGDGKRRRSPSREVSSSPSSRGRKRERDRYPRKSYKSRRTPSPSSPSSKGSSSSSSSYGSSSSGRHKRRRHDKYPAWKRSRKLQKFREGGKNITFQSYDGSYGATDKVLAFIQQFDAAFGGEDFTESSKLRHVAMHFTKAARQWWASLKTQDTHPKTWKQCRAAIMKQFLTENAKDEVLTAWRGLKLERGESIQQYINKFWDLHLKAIVFKKIDFAEQRQQYCAGLTEDIRSYVNDQKPRTIAEVIHRSKVAMKIFPISKGASKPPERNEKVHLGEQVSKANKGNGSNEKKEKKFYQGKGKLSPEEMERYKTENRCYKCGEQGHISRACPQRQQRKEAPQAKKILYPSKEAKGASRLCFAWGKIRDVNSLILFDPGSSENFISTELAQKLGIQTEEMGMAIEAQGAFKGQQVPVTPLIGKLRVHVQGYVDQEEFYISPLATEDVILGAPWFDRLAAKLEYPSRVISFQFRNRDISIHTEDRGSTIPIVSHASLQKSIKSNLFAYLIFAHDQKSGDQNVDSQDQQGFLTKYKQCFADELPNELPPSRGDDDHKIDLVPGSSPPNRPPYRVSYAQQEEILSQVNELLEKGLIRPSSSPFCSPVLLVQKKDGSYRMCIDYRALNKQTIKNRFPVPRIEDIFDRLQGSTYYSRLDLKSGYHQIRIVPEDIHKTAFRTQFGLYEYAVMPFGLTNAPATFNRLMEKIFRKHSAYTGVFFDDIIVHSQTLEEHKEHLQAVFDELRANKLYVNGKKSEFFMKEIKYLGHIISKEGIRMDPEKLRVIEEWPEPHNVHELRSFLGMCSYYRRFIAHFSVIAGPLHDLTKKKVPYKWTLREQSAFIELKAKLMSQPLLVLPDLKKPFEVHCDACGDSIGAVLSQEGHPVAYESRRLHEQERSLGVYEKELLSVIHALASWKHYLLGTAFVIYTDHQSIRYFMTQTKLSEKQMRWANFLSQFHFHIAHVSGKQNLVADALSRRPRVNAVSIAYHHDLTSMIEKYAEDSDYQEVMARLAQGQNQDHYSLKEGFLLYGNRLCVTKDMRGKVMSESHEPPYAGHRGIQPTTQAIELYFYWPHMRQDIEDYVSKCIVCQKVKYERGKASGLLQPLPIPDSPWQSISMDFVFGLPKSTQGNNGIWTIIDRFSKQAHFLPVKKTIKAKNMAAMFISQIFKYHGLPSSIVSDRDPRMTSLFWRGMFENLGTKLNFSSAYHPETDGQSEIANSIVLDLLKNYVGEVAQANQWEKYLPLVEYAYNNTIHSVTGKTPFEVIEGRPRLPLILKPHSKIFAADEEVRDIRVAFDKIKESIHLAQQKYKRAADKKRKPLEFKDDDWVLLRFSKARLRNTTGKNWKGEHTGHQKYYMKLAKRYYGPFQILSRINETAYKLKLPANWHIHNAFHVSLLKPFKGDPPKEQVQEEPPLFDELEEVLQPEEILKHEENTLQSGKVIRRYLVKFKHYTNEDSKWMQETQLKDVLPLLQDYKRLHQLM